MAGNTKLSLTMAILDFVDRALPDGIDEAVAVLRSRVAQLRAYRMADYMVSEATVRALIAHAHGGDEVAAAVVVASSRVDAVSAERSGLGRPAVVWTLRGRWNTPPLTRFRAVTVGHPDAPEGYVDAVLGAAEAFPGRGPSAVYPAGVPGLGRAWAGAEVFHAGGAVSRGSPADPFAPPAVSLRDGSRMYRVAGAPARCGVMPSSVFASGAVFFAPLGAGLLEPPG